MLLVQISFYVPSQEKIKFSKEDGTLNMVAVMYNYQLSRYETEKVRKVSIQLVTDAQSENKIEELFPVIQITKRFDQSKYDSASITDRKVYVLNIIHESMLYLAGARSWDVAPLKAGYETCLRNNLEFTGLYNGKYYLSPDKKYYATVFFNWESDKYQAFALFFDKKKIEIQRAKLFESKGPWVDDIESLEWDTTDTVQFVVTRKFPKRRHAAKLKVEISQ